MPATRIPIDAPNAPTALLVERGAVARLGEVLAREGVRIGGRAVVLIVDEAVRTTHGARAAAALTAAGASVNLVPTIANERAKSMRAVETIWSDALAGGADRGALFIALGGGLVGDVGGFAAATFLRGVELVQVPTTLLAMVDASIGGKTGVNLELPGGGLGKNLAGSFWQPTITIADADTLSTLPIRELRAGLAECAKHAVIAGEPLFGSLERDAMALSMGDPAAIDGLVPASAAVKAGIVSRDPFEKGERAILNLGHTFGHAIETIPSLELLHGEAVAIGLVAACRTAVALGRLEPSTADRIVGLLGALQLPTRLSEPVAAAEIRRRMGFDKKVAAGVLRLVLPSAVGRIEVVEGVAEDAVAAGLASIGARV
ncbi:MAG: shikimate kinase/3-dehydroquinate synthase [Planctomycetota bacterium]|jgi:3-dehydroquinate synthase